MTTKDPYPEALLVEEVETTDPDPLVRAVNRLAEAVEQNTLAILHPTNGSNGPRPVLAPLPPVQGTGLCPTHGQPWKTIPGGISKRTGNAYEAFQACPVQGCDQRPPR